MKAFQNERSVAEQNIRDGHWFLNWHLGNFLVMNTSNDWQHFWTRVNAGRMLLERLIRRVQWRYDSMTCSQPCNYHHCQCWLVVESSQWMSQCSLGLLYSDTIHDGIGSIFILIRLFSSAALTISIAIYCDESLYFQFIV